MLYNIEKRKLEHLRNTNIHMRLMTYQIVTDWELDNRQAPEYVLRLLEYYIRHKNFCRESDKYE